MKITIPIDLFFQTLMNVRILTNVYMVDHVWIHQVLLYVCVFWEDLAPTVN